MVLLSPEEQQCTLTSAPPTVSLSTFLVTVFTVVIFFILVTVAIVIITIAICAAKQRKTTSQRYITHVKCQIACYAMMVIWYVRFYLEAVGCEL